MKETGLSESTVELFRSVLSGFKEVEKAVLYGSRATGNFRNGSDIDLTLYGPDLTTEILHRISGNLEDSSMPYSVDLSIFDQIDNKDLVGHIERVGIDFYTKPHGG